MIMGSRTLTPLVEAPGPDEAETKVDNYSAKCAFLSSAVP
jgi:hypothetical protein